MHALAPADPISREYAPRSFRDLLARFLRRPPHKQLPLLLELARGLLTSPAFDEASWPRVERGVRVRKRNGRLLLGQFVQLGGNVSIAVTGRGGLSATLRIGSYTSIGPSTGINVTDRIDIGDRCLIAWNCDIMDTDFHRIEWPDGEAERPVSAPVRIEDDVWIGARSIILKGVTIGRNSVIGAGAVVVSDIPPNSFAAGNPARAIRPIKGWRR